ncbi:MAG: hypothetical protein PWQ62_1237 [Candidatus Methanomethylophilaceae archaeon]|nr:hypothetical protein [Candidatus Methanomethylophilaceae archaeon]
MLLVGSENREGRADIQGGPGRVGATAHGATGGEVGHHVGERLQPDEERAAESGEDRT